MKSIQRGFPGLLIAVLACQVSSTPDFGSMERFQEDVVVGNFISQQLATARENAEAPEPWIRLGMTFEANDFLAEALTSYEHAMQLDGGTTARTWYRLGNTHKAMGNFAAALQSFDASIAADPEYPPTHWRRGQVHLTLGQNDQAATDFQRALELDDSQFPATLGLARIHLQSDDPEGATRAVELMEPLVRQFPRMRPARTLLGLAYRKLERIEEARRHLKAGAAGAASVQTSDKALVFGRYIRDPWQRELKDVRVSHRMVLIKARQAFMQGDLEGAAATLEELRQHRPDDVTLGLNLANVYRQTERVDASIALLQDLLERHPQRFHLAMDLAWSHFEANDEVSALAMARRAAAIDPHHPGPATLEGRINGTIPAPTAQAPAPDAQPELVPEQKP